MIAHCIHGFRTDECASCRTCPHGLTVGRCGRCVGSNVATRRRQPIVEHPAEQHAGFEIFFEPRVSGWHYRAPGAEPSSLSYRSSFLARKAVDQLAEGSRSAAKTARLANESP